MAIDLQLREELPEDAIVFDNPSFDHAIIGVTIDGRVVYDYHIMIMELANEEGWSGEEATDWVEYNTIRAHPYIGPNAPIIMYCIQNN